MNKVLKDIDDGKYEGQPASKVKRTTNKQYERKQNWYKIGEVLSRGHIVKLHKESLVTARRNYEYYSIDCG